MIERLLPASVATAWTTRDEAEGGLFPEEETCLRQAVEARRREFTTGRRCARRALAGLGLPARPVPAGPRGEPLWPPEVVGSITHCRGYRAAAVARRAEVRALGIDAEEHRPLPPDVVGSVLLADEREHVARLGGAAPGIHWETVVFSAKESVYKAWFPLTGRWLGFHDARVRVNSDGTFLARLLVPGPTLDGISVTEFRGRWRQRGNVILTALAWSASSQAGAWPGAAVPPQAGAFPQAEALPQAEAALRGRNGVAMRGPQLGLP